MPSKRAISDYDKKARRGVILSAALDAFFEHGFAASRMDDIAARAGVTKGTLYLYFASKDVLFGELIASVAKPNIERIEAIAKMDAPIGRIILEMIEFAPIMIKQSDTPRLMKVLISEANSFPDVIRDYREKVIDRAHLSLMDLFDAAMKRGEIEHCNPAFVARLFVAPIVMSSIWHVVFAPTAPYEIDPKHLLMEHAVVFMRGLGIDLPPQEDVSL